MPETRLLSIDAIHPEAEALRAAAATFRAGGLVAFPTETVYGIGANALDDAAVRRVFDAKGRPAVNPLIVHVNGPAMARKLVADWSARAQMASDRFWPGPLTLILPKRESVPGVVTAGGNTVGVRMPAHPVALGLISAAGVPLAAPSANRSGELSPTRAEHVLVGLSGRIDLILDAGRTTNGIESTVLDLTTDPPTLLRPGPIGPMELESVFGPIRRWAKAREGPLPSPGLLPRHYAPRTPIELHAGRAAIDETAASLGRDGVTCGMVLLGGAETTDPNQVVLPPRPGEYGARLYEVLHYLDALRLGRILVELPPDEDQWLAIRDRLMRAAAP